MVLLDTRALVIREQDPEVLRRALLGVLQQVDLANEFAAERTLLSRLIGPTVRRVAEDVRLAAFRALTDADYPVPEPGPRHHVELYRTGIPATFGWQCMDCGGGFGGLRTVAMARTCGAAHGDVLEP